MAGYFSNFVENRPMQETSIFPAFIVSVFELVASYGWYMVFTAIAGYFLWRTVSPLIWRVVGSWQDEDPVTSDPSGSPAQQAALLSSRQRLQELVQRTSHLAEEHRQDLEEERRLLRSGEWQRPGPLRGSGHSKPDGGRKSGNKGDSPSQPKPKKDTKKGPSYKPNEYNPLAGHGGGGGYRRSQGVQRGGG